MYGSDIKRLFQNGVRAPLLADVQETQTKTGPDTNFSGHARLKESQYLPKTRGNAGTGRGNSITSLSPPQSRNAVTNSGSLDYSKLTDYNWKASDEAKPKISFAPDRLYKNTYTLQPQRSSSSLTAPVTSLPFDLPKLKKPKTQRPVTVGQLDFSNTVQTLLRDKDFERKRGPRGRGIFIETLHNVSRKPFFEVKTILTPREQDSYVDESEDTLYSHLQQSMETLTSPRIPKNSKHGIKIDRPMKREKGKYRPMSNTVIKTPRICSPVLEGKEYKSADTYKQIMESKQKDQVDGSSSSSDSYEKSRRGRRTKPGKLSSALSKSKTRDSSSRFSMASATTLSSFTSSYAYFDDEDNRALNSVIQMNKPGQLRINTSDLLDEVGDQDSINDSVSLGDEGMSSFTNAAGNAATPFQQTQGMGNTFENDEGIYINENVEYPSPVPGDLTETPLPPMGTSDAKIRTL